MKDTFEEVVVELIDLDEDIITTSCTGDQVCPEYDDNGLPFVPIPGQQ